MPSAPHTRLRDRWISAVLRHHVLVLVLAVIVTAVAGWLASRLRIDSDIRSLMPADHPVLVSLDQIEASFGSLGSVNVVVKHGTVEQRHAFADAVAERIGRLEQISDVEYRLRGDFFADHALYFLGDAEMTELDERVQAWSHHELCRAEPDVCVSKPDPDAPEALRTFIRAKQDAALARTRFRDYFERDGIDALVLLAHPKQASSDLAFSLAIAADARAAVAEVRAREGAAWSGSDLTFNVVGPYIVKADEQVTIGGDMLKSGTFGFLGVVLILYLLLRSGRAVLTLLVPLACGVTWSMAFTQLVLGHLNTLTSLISTVVMGMGIDAGIHYLLRVREEQAGVSDREAIARAFHGLIVPLLVASGTTLGAFAVMASSDLPAFQEFGIIAGSGVALCLLAMVTVYPAALLLGGVKRVSKRRSAGVTGALLQTLVLRRPGLTLTAVVAVTAVLLLGARRVQFENNGRALQSDHTRALTEADTRLISDIFQRDIHAGILVVDTLEQARAVLTAARANPRPDTTVAEVFAAPDLLPDPAIDPEQRRLAISAITEDVPEAMWDRLDARASGEDDGKEEGDDKLSTADAQRLRRMLKAEPVTLDRLPPALRDKLYGRDGRFAVLAYPNFDAADIFKGLDFMAETSAFTAPLGRPEGEAVFVGETTVYALMYRMMASEAPFILLVAAGLIAALVLAQLRSLGQTLLTLVPLALGMLWLVGVMGLCGVRFTLFNIPILPVIIGIGIDNGVYLTDRIRLLRGAPDGLASALGGTGAAILAATATTVMGFLAFVIADNGGLRGIGLLAALGISIAALTALLVLPSIAALLHRVTK